MGAHHGATSVDPPPTSEPIRLTPAEARVLPWLATYLTLEGIAKRLGVSRSTVKTHVVSIYKKLGVSTRTQAIEHAEEIGLLPEAGTAPAIRPAALSSRPAGDTASRQAGEHAPAGHPRARYG
jgi:DNA-binding CsgD family transcriptional regulator